MDFKANSFVQGYPRPVFLEAVLTPNPRGTKTLKLKSAKDMRCGGDQGWWHCSMHR